MMLPATNQPLASENHSLNNKNRPRGQNIAVATRLAITWATKQPT
jgi:hypothetical protein